MTTKFTLAQLAEGVTRRSLGDDAPRLVKKWEQTSLLEGLKGNKKQTMARLLENQAAELLKETNSLSTGGAGLTSSGKVTGFTNVAFPIVRRVFAGLIANEIVSVQPMSLPSGLLFYLDYTYGSSVGGDAGTAANQYSVNAVTNPSTYTSQDSVYNNPRGVGVRSGSLAAGGQYDLVGAGYSKVHKQSKTISVGGGAVGSWATGSLWTNTLTVKTADDFTGYNARFVNYDGKVENDLTDNILDYVFVHVSASEITTNIAGADLTNLDQISVTGFGSVANSAAEWGEKYQGGRGVLNLRKLNKRGNWNGSTFTPDPMGGSHVQFVVAVANAGTAPAPTAVAGTQITGSAAISDALSVNSTDGSALTIPSFETDFAVDASPRIPEVDIRIESTSVTAATRKLRAKWSPEMAQDLTAFYSIDVEVELTNILSEMITLDIDREILNDLLTQANAANLYWSRAPGKIVNKVTGAEALMASSLSPGPMVFANVQEWYQTLLETITDVANTIHKKTLRGSGNFIVTSPDVATIFEHMTAYRAAYKLDGDGQVKDSMTLGAEPIGTLNNRYTVYKDPYFPANKVLVGLKGNTFLESGYIYAPYVPLILTPVIYGTEDFTPRKGIMTRYGRKMVRSDFYGTVTVLDLNLI
jgi:hypothetical protein